MMMRKLIAIIALASFLVLGGCAQGQVPASSDASPDSAVSTSAASQSSEGTPSAVSAESADSLVIHVGDTQFTMALADTEAARALVEQLQVGPVTVSLHAYGGFEQVGPLPWSLPTNDKQTTTSPGDVMLYQGDQITIFIGSNSWAYTPLGNIEDATSETLLDAFGGDAVEITLSLA